MAYTLVNAGTVVNPTSGTTVVPTKTASVAGNLLVMVIGISGGTPQPTLTPPGGWQLAVAAYNTSGWSLSSIYYYPNCPAGITSVSVTCSATLGGSIVGFGQILEFNDPAGSNVSPLDVTGTATASTSPLTISTSSVTTAAHDLAVSGFTTFYSSSTKVTLSPGAGFTMAGSINNGVKANNFACADYQLDAGASAGTTVTDSVTNLAGNNGNAGAIATFKVYTPPTNYAFVGTVTNSASAAITSFSFTSHTVGNFTLIEVASFNGTRTATSLSSTNATWVALGTPYTSTAGPGRFQVFIGTVTSVATATVTITWGAGTAGAFESASGFEFSTTVGIPVLDVQTHLDNGGGVAAWPSLTPAVNGELYFGYAFNLTTSGTTSTPGYIGTTDGGTNGFAYNPNCAAGVATAPTWSDAGQECGIMVLVRPAGAAAGILPQQLKKRMPAVFTRLITSKPAGAYSR